MTSNGAGAAARKSIGFTVFSGMLASTILAVALVPVFFLLVAQWQEHIGPKPAPLDAPAGKAPH
jgi:HAE1 family hydrophobic/amphiphilic exporter-1